MKRKSNEVSDQRDPVFCIPEKNLQPMFQIQDMATLWKIYCTSYPHPIATCRVEEFMANLLDPLPQQTSVKGLTVGLVVQLSSPVISCMQHHHNLLAIEFWRSIELWWPMVCYCVLMFVIIAHCNSSSTSKTAATTSEDPSSTRN